MFKYPKEIWSKIPTVNEFITKVLDQTKDSKNQEDLLYLSAENENYQELGVEKALKDAKFYLVNSQSYNSLDRYIGSYGIAGDVERSLLAKMIADGHGIMMRNSKAKLGKGWVVKKGEEKEFQKIYGISNYRDYYYPFIFNKEEKWWEEAEDKKGWLLIERTVSRNNLNNNDVPQGEFRSIGRFKIGKRRYEKREEFFLYNLKSAELVIVPEGQAINLK
jgi:hypothetical protein